MSEQRGDDVIRCSFCGRTAHEVTSMVAGPDVYICDRCIFDASGIVRNDLAAYQHSSPSPSRRPSAHRRRMTPHEIKKALDEYVIGQNRAKKALAVAVYNHYKRVEARGVKDTPVGRPTRSPRWWPGRMCTSATGVSSTPRAFALPDAFLERLRRIVPAGVGVPIDAVQAQPEGF